MNKYFSACIKGGVALKIECSDAPYWEFLKSNLIWLKKSEAVSSTAADIETRISKIQVLDDPFVARMTDGYDLLGYNLFIKGSSVICLYGRWLLWRYEGGRDRKIHIDMENWSAIFSKKCHFKDILLITWKIQRSHYISVYNIFSNTNTVTH